MKSTKLVTLDNSGRMVLPKTIRETAGFQPGVALDVRARAGEVVLRIAPREVEIREAEDGLPLVVPRDQRPDTLSSRAVRTTLEDVRAGRDEG